MNDKKEKVIYWYVNDHPDVAGIKCLMMEHDDVVYCSSVFTKQIYHKNSGPNRVEHYKEFLETLFPEFEYIFIEKQ